MICPAATRYQPAASRLALTPSDDPTLRLGLLEKRPQSINKELPPLLITHGASFSSRVFDLPRAGYSLMDAMAADGRTVYALDVRGFGTSLASRVMDEPPDCNGPFAGLEQAIVDLAAAVEMILTRQSVTTLDLAGFSWGAILAARFAGQSAGRLRRLALYAPLYRRADLSALGRIAKDGVASGAYGLTTLDDVVRRWDSGLPAGSDPAAYREAGIAELLFEAMAALDPEAIGRSPPAFRCPRGPLADLAKIARGETLFDPAALTMPTLIVRGADDTTSTDADCRDLLMQLAAPDKAYESIAPGSHFLLLERNRARLYDRLNAFLAARGPA